MKISRLSLTVALLGLSTLIGASAARACKYCWAAEAANSEYTQQSMLPQGTTDAPPGAFPLDSTISQFKPTAAPAALATPPPAGSIATSAADLRPAKATASLPAPAPAPAALATAQPAAAAPAGKAGHFADAGLLGLAAVGGVFCWRTRRKTGSGH